MWNSFMWNSIVDLFGSRLWEPHGHCFLWTPSLLWTMVIANSLIAFAYYSIPFTLLTLVRRRQDLVHKSVFVLFALFIFGCGTTHLVKIWTLWMPVYWLQGTVDALTAWVSILTAVTLWPLLPKVLALPSPAQWQAANQALQEKIRVQQQTEAALQHRTLALEAANEELEAFTYTASHDLKTPLRAIHHLATWISEDAADVLPARSQEHLTKLRGRIKHLETLLNDLLAYARASRQSHTPEVVDTHALVHETVALLAPPLGFTIHTDGLPTLQTERVPLETVLRNLISNAIQHHHQPQQGQVHVTAVEQEAAIVFTVADNGPGIDGQHHERIFGLFQTLGAPQGEGSGMGLAIVKKLVESRGGRIAVESAVGQGTRFHFTWPKAHSVEKLAQSPPIHAGRPSSLGQDR